MAGQFGSMTQAYQSLRAAHFPTDGEFFFVDGVNGSSSNSGLTPDEPLLLLTDALTLATAQMDDFIFVLDYHQPTGETWPIVAAKRSAHIVGVTSALEDKPHINGDSASCFNLNGATYGSSRMEFANLGFCAGSSNACIDINSTCFAVKIHDCSFGHSYTGAQDGIEVNAPYDAVELQIYDCIFGSMLTNYGIKIVNNATRCRIYNNFFEQCGAGGMSLGASAGMSYPYVCDNRFDCKTDEDGEAIHIDGSGGMLTGNVANDDKVTMTGQPFKDDGDCNWGINYTFNVADTPV